MTNYFVLSRCLCVLALSGGVAWEVMAEKPEKLAKQLHAAAKKGDVTEVQRLLSEGVDPNTWRGTLIETTPLAKAIRHNHPEVFDLLVQKVYVDASRSKGPTALYWAAAECREEMARVLIERGANVNFKEESGGQSPLFISSHAGCEAVVEQLLQAGAEPNVVRFDGSTPLMTAAAIGYKSIVESLLDAGANPNLSDTTGMTVLSWAKQGGKTEIVEYLRSRGTEDTSPGALPQSRRVSQVAEMGRVSFRQSCPSGPSSFLYMGTGKAFEVDVKAASRDELLKTELFQRLLGEALQAVKAQCADAHMLRAIHVFVSEGSSSRSVAEAAYEIDALTNEGRWVWENQLYAEHIHSELINIHGIEDFFPNGNELVANPFLHQDKKVAVPLIFRTMETSTIARFAAGAGDLILTGVRPDQFTVPGTSFYVAGRVAGKQNVEGVGRLTSLEFIIAYACYQENCGDIAPP